MNMPKKIPIQEREVVYMKKQKVETDKSVWNRYTEMLKIIGDDDIALNLLTNLINAACRYISVVCANEHAIKMQKYRLEGDDYRKFIESLDINRKSAHEALISALHSFNRYCIKEFEDTPVGGIYTFDPLTIRNRVAVADWAMTFILSLFEHRSK